MKKRRIAAIVAALGFLVPHVAWADVTIVSRGAACHVLLSALVLDLGLGENQTAFCTPSPSPPDFTTFSGTATGEVLLSDMSGSGRGTGTVTLDASLSLDSSGNLRSVHSEGSVSVSASASGGGSTGQADGSSSLSVRFEITGQPYSYFLGGSLSATASAPLEGVSGVVVELRNERTGTVVVSRLAESVPGVLGRPGLTGLPEVTLADSGLLIPGRYVLVLQVNTDAGAAIPLTEQGSASENHTVTFTVLPSVGLLSVTTQGALGLGTVTSDLAGIACGPDCSESYAGGTMVTLTAATRRGLLFSGWSGGGCTGTGTCPVTLNTDTTVTATFTPPPDRPVITAPLEDDVMIAAGGGLPMSWTAVAGATQYGLEFAGQNLPFTNPGGFGPDAVNGLGGAGGGFPILGTSTNLAVPPGTPAGAYKVRIVGLSPAFLPVGRFSDAITLLIGATGAGQPTFTAPAAASLVPRGTLVTFTWDGVANASQYLFEFEGGPDPGRLGGNLTVAGTSLPAIVPANVPTGTYRVRVLGLSATGAPVGTFSSPLTFTVQ